MSIPYFMCKILLQVKETSLPSYSPGTYIMKSSGYFVYDEQYVHINGKDRYRALLKDSKSGLFVEEILDDLSQSTLTGFFIRSLKT